MNNILSFLENLQSGINSEEAKLLEKEKMYPFCYTAKEARELRGKFTHNTPRISNHPDVAYLEDLICRSIERNVSSFRYVLSDSSLEESLNEALSESGYKFTSKKFRDVLGGDLIEYKISWEEEKS